MTVRITGSEKLDPDFSKIKRLTRPLGIIFRKNLYAPGSSREWLLPRINPVCENCGQNQTHQVVMEYHCIIPFLKLSKRYHLICSECSEKIELDYGEYLKLKPYLE
jgi:hypothetical protein